MVRQNEESIVFLLPNERIFVDENFSCWGECKILEIGILELIVFKNSETRLF